MSLLGALGATGNAPISVLQAHVPAPMSVLASASASAAGMHRTFFPSSCTSKGPRPVPLVRVETQEEVDAGAGRLEQCPGRPTPVPAEAPPRSMSPNLNRQPHSEVPAYRRRAPVCRCSRRTSLLLFNARHSQGCGHTCKGGRGRLLISGL